MNMHRVILGFVTAMGCSGAAVAQVYNTAYGVNALSGDTGLSNSAFGYGALRYNIDGSDNVAVGATSLVLNANGSSNTAVGNNTLLNNSNGGDNVAIGDSALFANLIGKGNTANGRAALGYNKRGNFNVATGYTALFGNISGNGNSAHGAAAQYGNTTGMRNSALGTNSLYSNTTGSYNIAVGYQAAYYPKNGSYNIEIGSAGATADNAVIRIGTQGTQKATYLAGVRGVNVTGGVQVMVTSTGQLGVVSSSRRYKEDIRSMGDTSDRLLKLHPVVFRYKQPDESGQKPEQYGLIAEEVAKVMPELVIYNDKGQPETVAYQTLTPLLLNELQKEHKQMEQMQAEINELRKSH